MESLKKYYLLILMFSLANVILISCNVKQKEHNDILVSKTKFSEGFKVSMFISAEKDDFFDMFYVLDSLNEKFSESYKIRKNIKGSRKPQQVLFQVKEQNVLKFRIDLGRNIKQKNITIHSLEITSKSKSIQIKGNLLSYFFNENKFMKFIKNGEIAFTPNRKKTPFMTSSALLNKKMQIEF